MKQLILGLFVLGAVGCQHSSPALTKTAIVALKTSAVAKQGVATAPLANSAVSLSPEALMLLRQHDLAPLWANQTESMKSHPTLEGFYGPTHYRISFYFSKVERDAKQPNLFHVEGLDRYKKVITPFVGTITVQTVQPFTKEMFVDADSTAQAFTAAGRFEFTEDPTTKGASKYNGKALLDFYIDQQGHLDHAFALVGASEYKNPTKGCGLLFSGSQSSNKTGLRNPVAFANFYGAVVPQEIKKLGLGDRSEEMNPNLAKLGWNEAWENDEWWTTSPEPALGL
jgi:hypothetical protein